MEAELFKALGDPLRLRLVKRLSGGSVYTLGDLTKGLGISRQGARKQIGVLASAKIVRLKQVGREVEVLFNVGALKSGKEFITNLEIEWDKRLKRLKDLIEND